MLIIGELFFAYENNYQGQEKNLNSESLTQEIAYEYLLLVIRSLARNLADFPCHLPGAFDNLNE